MESKYNRESIKIDKVRVLTQALEAMELDPVAPPFGESKFISVLREHDRETALSKLMEIIKTM